MVASQSQLASRLERANLKQNLLTAQLHVFNYRDLRTIDWLAETHTFNLKFSLTILFFVSRLYPVSFLEPPSCDA